MSRTVTRPGAGPLLREWRRRRHLSQLDLALEANVSARHLSFIETGRSRPSAEMLLHLSEQLEIPLRERNALLLAAGHAPAYAQRELDAPELGPVRDALERVLAGHAPYPALVVDRHWGLVAANASDGPAHRGRRAAPARAAGQRPAAEPAPRGRRAADREPARVARPPARPARPRGGGRRRPGARRAARGAARATPAAGRAVAPDLEAGAIAVPLRLRHGDAELAFISTVTMFGTAVDVTVSELSIESFFPADAATAAAVRALAR